MSVYHFIERRALERGKTVALFGLLALAVLQPIWLATVHRQKERFVVLNGPGSYTVAPALTFDEATDLHEDCGFQAARALLDRQPAGPRRPGEIDRWFLEDTRADAGRSARTKVSALIAAEAAEFQAKQFHQQMHLTEPARVVVLGETSVKVLFAGQLIRTGALQGRPHLETREFTLQLTLARNPNMMLNNRPPFAVWDFDYSLR